MRLDCGMGEAAQRKEQSEGRDLYDGMSAVRYLWPKVRDASLVFLRSHPFPLVLRLRDLKSLGGNPIRVRVSVPALRAVQRFAPRNANSSFAPFAPFGPFGPFAPFGLKSGVGLPSRNRSPGIGPPESVPRNRSAATTV